MTRTTCKKERKLLTKKEKESVEKVDYKGTTAPKISDILQNLAQLPFVKIFAVTKKKNLRRL